MVNGVEEQVPAAEKKDPFVKKAARLYVNKMRVFIKLLKRELFGHDGDYYYGATAQDYEAKRTKEDFWHEENRVVSEILKELPKGMSVLDAPFGTGRFLPLYAEHQMKVTGLDISYEMLSAAKGLRKDLAKECQLDIGDARNLPYEDNSFDVVVSFRFLDGIVGFHDHKKVLAEFARVSRKYLILEVFSRPDEDNSKLLIRKLRRNQLIDGMLSGSERRELFEIFGIKVIKEVPAGMELGKRTVVYLCEKNNKCCSNML